MGEPRLTIWLLRHGQTHANVACIMQGQSGGELTELGHLQARAAGRRLAKLPAFSAIYCSDLHRTRQTVDEVCTAPGAAFPAPVFTAILRERACGDFEGLPYGAGAAAARLAGVPAREFKAPGGGESWTDVGDRATAFLQSVVSSHLAAQGSGPACSSVLVVTHGGWIREATLAWRSYAEPKPGASATAPAAAAPNASLYRFEVVHRRSHSASPLVSPPVPPAAEFTCVLTLSADVSHLAGLGGATGHEKKRQGSTGAGGRGSGGRGGGGRTVTTKDEGGAGHRH